MARSRKDIGSRLSRYPPDCSEVMARVGGRVSARRGAYMGARRQPVPMMDKLKFKKSKKKLARDKKCIADDLHRIFPLPSPYMGPYY